MIGVCQQLFIDLTQQHKVVLARPLPAINLITMQGYVHSSAQHKTKQNALLRLGNRDINIMATTNNVLVNMCNNPTLLLSKRVFRKKTWNKELNCHPFHIAWRDVMRAFAYVMCASFTSVMRVYARIRTEYARMRCKCEHSHRIACESI